MRLSTDARQLQKRREKMKKGLAIGMVLVLLIPALALAQQGRPEWGPRGGERCFDAARQYHEQGLCEQRHRGKGMGIRHLLAVGDEINLSDDQQAKLEQMIVEFRLEGIDLKASIEKAQVELQALKRDDAVESDVMRAIDDVARLKAEMHKMQYRHHQQAKAVLTDDQIDQLKQLRKERFKEGRKFREKPGRGWRG
jgi:Spy/CpxP family protein refolding chaperone